jgi:hypothetical protein
MMRCTTPTIAGAPRSSEAPTGSKGPRRLRGQNRSSGPHRLRGHNRISGPHRISGALPRKTAVLSGLSRGVPQFRRTANQEKI